jgi:hypothetical protein
MPYFGYTDPCPVATNNPSVDQPNMTINTHSVLGIMAVDHFGFDNNNGGWHQKVTLINGTAAPGTLANQSILFNFFNGNGLAFQVAGQMAGAGFASLYNFNNAPGITLPVAAVNGYTCLPGPGQNSIIFQWGQFTRGASWPTSVQTLSFATANINFPGGCFNVITNFTGPNSSTTGDISIVSVSKSNFMWQFTGSSSSSLTGFYWIAIGY